MLMRSRGEPIEDQDDIAGRYRRARIYFVTALTLLIATAVYELLNTGKGVWDSTHHSAEVLAVGLQSRATAMLGQSAASLQGIASDLGGDVSPERMRVLRVLADAMRFDPVSAYLGVRSAAASGAILVDRTGHPANDALGDTLLRGLPHKLADGIDLWPPVQLPSDAAWYIPMTLGIGRPETAIDGVLALIPARTLVSGAESLQLIPNSWISLTKPDGTRLLRYAQNRRDTLIVRGPRVSPEVMKLVSGRASGTLDVVRMSQHARATITPNTAIAGYSRSPQFPLYIATLIPQSTVVSEWVREWVPQATVLVIGLVATILFARELNKALRRQQSFVTQQAYRATHDSLTGLLSRDAFMRLLDRAIATRPTEVFAVLMLDLNRFKDINDTLGHIQGDHVLEVVGARLKGLFTHNEESVARLGGDELAVFTRRADISEALDGLFVRLQACLGERIVIGGVELDLTASMGAALYPQDARCPIELLRCADIAMYSAKNDLRPFERYSKRTDHFNPEMLALKTELAKALREGGLSVAYQPMVRLTDRALTGFEALSRWTHPTFGVVAPSRYLSVIEGTELIHPFADSVLQMTLQQAASWRAAGNPLLVSVNISANNLLDHTFVERLSQQLDQAALPATLLELEVTETAVMRHPETTIRRLRAIRELGVRLAIDDFGTGYATLSYLKQLPVQTLKIDRSFILNLETDEADQRIVRTSIQLAHGFGMSVIAEGVESAEVAGRLCEYGCDCAQGYYFGIPGPAAQISFA